MVDIRPNALPAAILPLRTGDAVIVDQGADGVRQTNPISFTDSVAPVATQSEAQTGTDNIKRMTPLRTKQSIASEVGVTLASNSQGSKADTAVQSVNGKSGNAVSLDKNDVGLGNVDNTSDASKPVSIAQQSALDLKANTAVTISAGTGLTGGGTLSANRTIALNSASIASLAKAESSVQTVNGVAPTGGNVSVSAEEVRLQDSRSSAILESFAGSVNFVQTAGYSTVGDGGGALYKRVISEPSHAGKFQSADGAWWELALQPLNPKMFGAAGDGVANDYQAMQDCVSYADGRDICIDGMTIRVSSGAIILPSQGITLCGAGQIIYEGTGNLFECGEITKTTFTFTATAGQTAFVCDYALSGPYVEVFINGAQAIKDTGSDAWDFTRTASNLTVNFFGARTAGQTIRVECSRFSSSSGLDPWGRVHIKTGVIIKSTRVAEGRAFAVAWVEEMYPGRQFPRFVFEAGALIMGADGDKGFKNPLWLHGLQNGQIQGYIYGIGANDSTGATEADALTCPYGVYLTGSWTPSDLKFYGGMIGWFASAYAALGDSFEGLHISLATFLNCGYSVRWEGLPTDTGLLLVMKGCHANNFLGIVKTSYVGSVFCSDNDCFQNPSSSKTFFTFFDIGSGSQTGSIHDNQMSSFVAGASVIGTSLAEGSGFFRIHDNTYEAADNTGTYIGTIVYNNAYNNVIGPNSYINTGYAVDIRAGADYTGVITQGDVFRNPNSAYPRYSDLGENTWFDEPWFVGKPATTSIPNNTATDIQPPSISNPQALPLSVGLPSAPAWARRVKIDAVLMFAANATGTRWARILVGGVEAAGLQANMNAPAFGVAVLHLQGEVPVTSGQALLTQVQQTSGASLNLMNNSYIKVLYK